MTKHPFHLSRLFLPLAAMFLLMAIVNAPAYADSFAFYLGPQPGAVPTVNGEAVGPYPGQLTDTTSNTSSPVSMFMCLDGNINTNWGSTIDGTEAAPDTQQEDEVAFLASLLLYDAGENGVTLNSYSSPNPGPSYTQTFMNNYSGPITFAIWQIMGTLSSSEAADEPAGTQAYVNQAIAVYNDILNNPSSAEYASGQAFLSSIEIFTPTPPGSNQRFMTAIAQNDTFVASIVPEPGTLGLFAAGLLLAAIGRKRFAR